MNAGSIVKTYEETEKKKRSDQDQMFKKATERLQMLE
jgi:hypothetical protein